jgi:toxin ParE1/3/4
MQKFSFTSKAIEDLDEIWDYTLENWSEKQAELYYSLIIESCKKIASNPKLGKSYAIVKPKLLGYVSEQHILFYHVISKNEIVIIRILHGMMDLKNKLN